MEDQVCALCKWRPPEGETPEVGKFLALTHVCVRHPVVFERTMQMTPGDWVTELQPALRAAYRMAISGKLV